MNNISQITDVVKNDSAIGIETADRFIPVFLKSEDSWSEDEIAGPLGLSGFSEQLNQGLDVISAFQKVKSSVTKMLVSFFSPRVQNYAEDYTTLITSSIIDLQNGERMQLMDENYTKVYNESTSPAIVNFPELTDLNLQYGDLFLKYLKLTETKDKCRRFSKEIARIVEGINEQENDFGVAISDDKKAIMKSNLLLIVENAKLTDFENIDGEPNRIEIIKTLFAKRYSSVTQLLASFSKE